MEELIDNIPRTGAIAKSMKGVAQGYSCCLTMRVDLQCGAEGLSSLGKVAKLVVDLSEENQSYKLNLPIVGVLETPPQFPNRLFSTPGELQDSS